MSAPADLGGLVLPALVVLVLVLAVGGAVLGYVQDRRRREELFAWSVDRHWTYDGSDPALVHFLPDEPFGRGHGRAVTNAVHGLWGGRPALAFDYRYKVTSGSGKNRRTRTYRHGVVAVQLPVPLPRVHVGPENVFHRLAQAFGADDIEVESHAFNRRYRVEAQDRRAAFAILHPRLVETLTQVEPVEWRTDLSSRGPVIVSWWSGALEPTALQQRLLLLGHVVDAVPGWLWREAGWDPDAAAPEP